MNQASRLLSIFLIPKAWLSGLLGVPRTSLKTVLNRGTDFTAEQEDLLFELIQSLQKQGEEALVRAKEAELEAIRDRYKTGLSEYTSERTRLLTYEIKEAQLQLDELIERENQWTKILAQVAHLKQSLPENYSADPYISLWLDRIAAGGRKKLNAKHLMAKLRLEVRLAAMQAELAALVERS